ncbi:NUDIX domain-containing protein [Dactylosporangium sp. CA-152071]|uniref:NUDIX domain-containing protein n=1 Tax=Dactylosporangium sp. CA-152071 TaxID=3239933 RepID=UPI003D8A296B
MSEWLPPEEWFSKLAAFHAVVSVLITDTDGRVLLVKPNYQDRWTLPGGYVDEGEAPHEAAVREVREELGLNLQVGALLVVDWAPPAGARTRALMSFTFDGGTLDDPGRIRLRVEELDGFAFCTAAEVADRLPAAVSPRVSTARTARQRKCTMYLAGRGSVPFT